MWPGRTQPVCVKACSTTAIAVDIKGWVLPLSQNPLLLLQHCRQAPSLLLRPPQRLLRRLQLLCCAVQLGRQACSWHSCRKGNGGMHLSM